jgi:hypothetical protein
MSRLAQLDNDLFWAAETTSHRQTAARSDGHIGVSGPGDAMSLALPGSLIWLDRPAQSSGTPPLP